ncbi:MAG: MATE family efflux transporter [Acidobacteria bacterium]|nr:MAG: MATE family efflux transporter [Acidobacteriota bacterium]
MQEPQAHPFVRAPHRTMAMLSVPVMLSLVAEPLTGLVDTAFVARLGAGPLAALGVGTMAMSSFYWIFNFLGIGTQTETARSLGQQRAERAREVAGLALVMAAVIGVVLVLMGLPATAAIAGLLGARGEVAADATIYLRWRLASAPAVLILTAAFGALRGLQDMRTPLWIAGALNLLNVILDPILIFGAGPIPALGVAGAAMATVISQWFGAFLGVRAVFLRLGFPRHLRLSHAWRLLVVGRDLFMRTSLLTLFLLLTTRAATRIGTPAGAAHQAIRQVWLLTALLLDAYAATAQSLVGYFLGAGARATARRVATVACQWSLASGFALTAGMLAGGSLVAAALVPAGAEALFYPAWRVAALSMPLNALSFATDGLHWGSGDYRFLRNVMMLSTLCGAAGIWLLDESSAGALTMVWVVTAVWITLRAIFGLLRIWPGLGASPFSDLRGPDPAG